MQGTSTVDAIRRQRDRRLEAIAKAKAQESTSRVRAALKTTNDLAPQTSPDLRPVGNTTIGVNITPEAPALIASPNFGQAIAPVTTGASNILGSLIDSGLAGDSSLFRPQVDRYNPRGALDITAHARLMRQRRFDAQAQEDLDTRLGTHPKRRRYADASKLNISKFSSYTCSNVPK